MKLDLRQDIAPVVAQVAQRVSEYDASSNVGPGDHDHPIQQITLGYQFDQAAWIALVFDTRPDADAGYDGQWQSFIEENVLDCDAEHWIAAYESLFENETRVSITSVDGVEQTIQPHSDSEDDESEEELTTQLTELFGAVLRDALVQSRAKDVFGNLPLAPECVLRVDEHEGHYGWPDFDNRGNDPDEGRISL